VARGDRLHAIREDNSKWQGWVWYTSDSGLSGWLPVQVFDTLRIDETNCATRDFDTKELTVKNRRNPDHHRSVKRVVLV